jgi:peptidoglycan-associated lipoprotein
MLRLRLLPFLELTVAIPAPISTALRAAAMLFFVVVVAACSRSSNDAVGLTGAGNLGPGGGAPGSQQEFIVTVGDRVFFTTDSSSLTSEAMATLDKQAAWLNQYQNYRILIEGHADERGTREYNIALGARRSSVVVNYLVSKGVNAQRITSQSFGKERPVAICNDISCWSQNRRAVTVVQ